MADEHIHGLAGVEQILYWFWDPIGVRHDFPATWGEYSGYIGDLIPLLDSKPEEIAGALERIERVALDGPYSSHDHLLAVGAMISRTWRELTARGDAG